MDSANASCCNRSDGCSDDQRFDRRSFMELVWIGGTALGAAAIGLPAVAGPFEAKDFEKLIPADKKLSPDWIKSLFARGAPNGYRGAELDQIGMPVGGICAGQLISAATAGCGIGTSSISLATATAVVCPPAAEPVAPRAVLRAAHDAGGKTHDRPLDRTGFARSASAANTRLVTVGYPRPGLPVR